METATYEGAEAYKVVFSSGDVVYIAPDGSVLTTTKLQPVVVSVPATKPPKHRTHDDNNNNNTGGNNSAPSQPSGGGEGQGGGEHERERQRPAQRFAASLPLPGSAGFHQ